MERVITLVNNYQSIAIIGTCKNAGKTTALNHILIKASSNRSYTLGLTSIGRDGEEEDLVHGTHKPRIFVPKGHIVATAKNCYLNGDLTGEFLESTGFNTPMGEVIIIRAICGGYVELGGPTINTQLRQVIKRMHRWGANSVIVDGTIDRKSSASPLITEAVVLATGASFSEDPKEVIRNTVNAYTLLNTPSITDQKLRGDIRRKLKENRCVLVDKSDNFITFPSVPLNCVKNIAPKVDKNTNFLAFRGAITDTLIENIISSIPRIKDLKLVTEDGTKLFIKPGNMELLKKAGIDVLAIDPINVAAITVNPVSVKGFKMDASHLISSMKEKIQAPVLDIMGGGDNDLF